MIEVEIKLPIKNKEEVSAKLQEMGFVKADLICEEDVYFDNASGQIRKQGEALRVRKVQNLLTGKSQAVITYKGKKIDPVSMTRKELETGVSDGEICAGIFEALGFYKVPPAVIKKRQEYVLRRITACMDQVENLGNFLELEVVIPEKEDRKEALQQIEEILHKLGYTLKDTIRNSYLSMLQGREDE